MIDPKLLWRSMFVRLSIAVIVLAAVSALLVVRCR